MLLKRTYAFLEPYLRIAKVDRVSLENSRNDPPPEKQTTSSQPHTFLIVEDDELILEILVETLNEQGFHAEGITHPHLLTQTVAKFHPDVMLIDYYLPEKNGLQIVREYRREMGKIVYILMSAYPQIRNQAKEQAIPYLEKPFSVEQLLRLLNDTQKPASDRHTNMAEDLFALFFTAPLPS